MSKEVITLGNIESEKGKSHHRKNLIFLEDVDIDKIQVPNEVSSGEKNINSLLVKNITIKKLNHYP